MRSIRLTKHRTAILNLLKESTQALSAQQIHEQLPHINLVTIYRNLEQFTTLGTIKKFYLDSTEAVFEFQKRPHHHAICDDCHDVQHIHIDEAKLKEVLHLNNFSVSDIDIIVRGKCKKDHRKTTAH